MCGMMFTQGWSDNDVRSVGQHPTSRLLLLWLAQWAHPRQFRRGWDFGREFQNVTLKRILAATNSANADFDVWGSAKADKIVNQADKRRFIAGDLSNTWACPACCTAWRCCCCLFPFLPLEVRETLVDLKDPVSSVMLLLPGKYLHCITMHHCSLLKGNILNRLGAI